jgi:hypothetical protein
VSAPAIEFIVTSTRDFTKIRSNGDAIRFRILRRAGRTDIDGDWYSPRFELSRSAWRQIESAWNAERVAHPCKHGSCGGGRSCVIITVVPEREQFWREFLRDLLSRSDAWLVWDGRRAFVPLPPIEIAASLSHPTIFPNSSPN